MDGLFRCRLRSETIVYVEIAVYELGSLFSELLLALSCRHPEAKCNNGRARTVAEQVHVHTVFPNWLPRSVVLKPQET